MCVCFVCEKLQILFQERRSYTTRVHAVCWHFTVIEGISEDFPLHLSCESSRVKVSLCLEIRVLGFILQSEHLNAPRGIKVRALAAIELGQCEKSAEL